MLNWIAKHVSNYKIALELGIKIPNLNILCTSTINCMDIVNINAELIKCTQKFEQ